MKYGLLLVAALALAGCKENGSNQTNDMITICLDGVAYWYDGQGQTQMMSPRIDPETLSFVKCR
jgi:uncharacterized protein YcfL